MMTIEDFASILAATASHPDTLDRTVAAVQQWQLRQDFEDDFSLLEFQL
jgi:hypothetical protein